MSLLEEALNRQLKKMGMGPLKEPTLAQKSTPEPISEPIDTSGGKVIVKEIHLEYTKGTSDKEYNVMLVRVTDGYMVDFSFGRRGGFLQKGTKTITPTASLNHAMREYTKLVNEKKAKGYIAK
jgi:predicted DNA-binding WGR domain protein